MGKRFTKRFYSACCWSVPATNTEAKDVPYTDVKQQEGAPVKAKTRSPSMTETEIILSQCHEMYNTLRDDLARLYRKCKDLELQNAEILSRNFIVVENVDNFREPAALYSVTRGERLLPNSYFENENNPKRAKVKEDSHEATQINRKNVKYSMVEGNQSAYRRYDESIDVGSILVMVNDLDDDCPFKCMAQEYLNAEPVIRDEDKHNREDSKRKSTDYDYRSADPSDILQKEKTEHDHCVVEMKHSTTFQKVESVGNENVLVDSEYSCVTPLKKLCEDVYSALKNEVHFQKDEDKYFKSVATVDRFEEVKTECIFSVGEAEQIGVTEEAGSSCNEHDLDTFPSLIGLRANLIDVLEAAFRNTYVIDYSDLDSFCKKEFYPESFKSARNDYSIEIEAPTHDCKMTTTGYSDIVKTAVYKVHTIQPLRSLFREICNGNDCNKVESLENYKKLMHEDKLMMKGEHGNKEENERKKFPKEIGVIYEYTAVCYTQSKQRYAFLEKVSDNVTKPRDSIIDPAESLNQLFKRECDRIKAADSRTYGERKFDDHNNVCFHEVDDDGDMKSAEIVIIEKVMVLEHIVYKEEESTLCCIQYKTPNLNLARPVRHKVESILPKKSNLVFHDIVLLLKGLCKAVTDEEKPLTDQRYAVQVKVSDIASKPRYSIINPVGSLKQLFERECDKRKAGDSRTCGERKCDDFSMRTEDNVYVDEVDDDGCRKSAEIVNIKKVMEVIMYKEPGDTIHKEEESTLCCIQYKTPNINLARSVRNKVEAMLPQKSNLVFHDIVLLLKGLCTAVTDEEKPLTDQRYAVQVKVSDIASKPRYSIINPVGSLKQLFEREWDRRKAEDSRACGERKCDDFSLRTEDNVYVDEADDGDRKSAEIVNIKKVMEVIMHKEEESTLSCIQYKTPNTNLARPVRNKAEATLPPKSNLVFHKALCKAVTDEEKPSTDQTKCDPICKFGMSNDLKARNDPSTRAARARKKKKKAKDGYLNETDKLSSKHGKVSKQQDDRIQTMTQKNSEDAAFAPVPFQRQLCQAFLDKKSPPVKTEPPHDLNLKKVEHMGKNAASKQLVGTRKKKKELSDGHFGDGDQSSQSTQADRPASLKPMDLSTDDIEELSKSTTFVSDITTIFSTYDWEYRFVPKLEAATNLQELMRKGLLFDEHHSKFACLIVLDIVRFLQSSGISHSDICPRKVLLNHQGYPCLTGFECATAKGQNLQEHGCVPRRQIEYTSPELLQKGHQVTEAADIFSTGVLGIHLIFGRPPHKAVTRRQTKENILNEYFIPKFEPNGLLSKIGKRFLVSCIRKDINKRFSLKTCGSSLIDSIEWFKDYNRDELRNLTFPSPFLPILMKGSKH